MRQPLLRPQLARSLAASALAITAIACQTAQAQAQADGPMRGQPPMANVVNLSASAAQEVAQDLLTIVLSTTRDGSDAAAVQTQLKQALDAALSTAKSQALAGAMDVRTGAFSLYPRYDRSGKINGWNGSTELVLEGKDFSRISSTAGKVQGLTVQQVGFSLSRDAREKLEAEVQGRAVAQFRAKASELAKQFGFASYSLREVHVGSADQVQAPRPRMMAMEAKLTMSADMALPTEAGKATVGVTVSGSVVLGR